jgi:hypothetical protein
MKNVFITTTSVFSIAIAILMFAPRVGFAQTKNSLCVTEPEFTDVNAMGGTAALRLQGIRDWLDGLVPGSPSSSFLKGRNPDGSNFTFTDLDTNPTDPAQEISNAAGANNINPKVLLTTLRKEKPEVFGLSDRPGDRTLRTLAGCGTSSTARQQIQCMAQTFKNLFYNQLSQCQATIGGWDVDPTVPKQTGDTPGQEEDAAGNKCDVVPQSKAVAALFQYTPWIGRHFGCGYPLTPQYPGGVGGNGLFCQFWKQRGWEAPPSTELKVSLQNPTLSCPGPTKCISLNASGGTPPYSWTTNKPTSGPGAFPLTTSGVDNQNVKFRPPTNNPNYPGNAYAQAGFNKACANTSTVCTNGQLTQGCIVSVRARFYGCNDQMFPDDINTTWACINYPGVTNTISFCSSAIGNLPVRGSCGFTLTQCAGKDYFRWCSGTGLDMFTDRKDRRSPGMISGGCRPCLLEMQGAKVTVKDSTNPTPRSDRWTSIRSESRTTRSFWVSLPL